MGDLPHQAHRRRQLLIEPHAAKLHVSDAVQLDVEPRIRCRPDRGQRLALVFIVAEEMQLVLDDRAAQRAADLLILVGQDAFQHRVGRVPRAVAEVADERTAQQVRSRFRDDVHLHARGASLRRVEAVRDELELRDRIVAVPRLIARTEICSDLLAVDVQLELAHVDSILNRQRSLRVGPVSRREQRERHPVASLRRQLLHLALIDVAAQARRRRFDERRLRGDDDRFLH